MFPSAEEADPTMDDPCQPIRAADRLGRNRLQCVISSPCFCSAWEKRLRAFCLVSPYHHSSVPWEQLSSLLIISTRSVTRVDVNRRRSLRIAEIFAQLFNFRGKACNQKDWQLLIDFERCVQAAKSRYLLLLLCHFSTCPRRPCILWGCLLAFLS